MSSYNSKSNHKPLRGPIRNYNLRTRTLSQIKKLKDTSKLLDEFSSLINDPKQKYKDPDYKMREDTEPSFLESNIQASKNKNQSKKLGQNAFFGDIHNTAKKLINSSSIEKKRKRFSRRTYLGKQLTMSDSSDTDIDPNSMFDIRPINIGFKKNSKENKISSSLNENTNSNNSFGNSTSFDEVGGLQSHIQIVKEAVMMPLLYPDICSKFGLRPPRGILFHGPPGTGKTLLARALANSCSTQNQPVAFFMVNGSECLSKFIGEGERYLRELFKKANKLQPSIVFFDEMDGLAPARNNRNDQAHISMVTTLLALMDGLEDRGQVVVIGSTNRPDSLDPALRRPGRFDKELFFGYPDTSGRGQILKIHTKKWPKPLTQELFDYIVEKTCGWGGAEIQSLCNEIVMSSIRRAFPSLLNSPNTGLVDSSKINVDNSDIFSALRNLNKLAAERKNDLGILNPLFGDLVNNVCEIFTDANSRTNMGLSRVLISGGDGMGQEVIGQVIKSRLAEKKIHCYELNPAILVGGYIDGYAENKVYEAFSNAKKNLGVVIISGLSNWFTEEWELALLHCLSEIIGSERVGVLILSTKPFSEVTEKKLNSLVGENKFLLGNFPSKTIYEFFLPVEEIAKNTQPFNSTPSKFDVESIPNHAFDTYGNLACYCTSKNCPCSLTKPNIQEIIKDSTSKDATLDDAGNQPENFIQNNTSDQEETLVEDNNIELYHKPNSSNTYQHDEHNEEFNESFYQTESNYELSKDYVGSPLVNNYTSIENETNTTNYDDDDSSDDYFLNLYGGEIYQKSSIFDRLSKREGSVLKKIQGTINEILRDLICDPRLQILYDLNDLKESSYELSYLLNQITLKDMLKKNTKFSYLCYQQFAYDIVLLVDNIIIMGGIHFLQAIGKKTVFLNRENQFKFIKKTQKALFKLLKHVTCLSPDVSLGRVENLILELTNGRFYKTNELFSSRRKSYESDSQIESDISLSHLKQIKVTGIEDSMNEQLGTLLSDGKNEESNIHEFNNPNSEESNQQVNDKLLNIINDTDFRFIRSCFHRCQRAINCGFVLEEEMNAALLLLDIVYSAAFDMVDIDLMIESRTLALKYAQFSQNNFETLISGNYSETKSRKNYSNDIGYTPSKRFKSNSGYSQIFKQETDDSLLDSYTDEQPVPKKEIKVEHTQVRSVDYVDPLLKDNIIWDRKNFDNTKNFDEDTDFENGTSGRKIARKEKLLSEVQNIGKQKGEKQDVKSEETGVNIVSENKNGKIGEENNLEGNESVDNGLANNRKDGGSSLKIKVKNPNHKNNMKRLVVKEEQCVCHKNVLLHSPITADQTTIKRFFMNKLVPVISSNASVETLESVHLQMIRAIRNCQKHFFESNMQASRDKNVEKLKDKNKMNVVDIERSVSDGDGWTRYVVDALEVVVNRNISDLKVEK
ncbi:hypothetical protein BB558_006661 [Smittium angustum]|uniref:AAA+ ATPase domain-containing protein n=1 Tax=Smittium angustum TaxID=133377 RepID=A0A2U1IX40_SMIAN|nr:hypothetical protein BB558_006661 [Smittium angustum]